MKGILNLWTSLIYSFSFLIILIIKYRTPEQGVAKIGDFQYFDIFSITKKTPTNGLQNYYKISL